MSAQAFKLGECFDSFAELEEKIIQYERQNYVNPWVRSSRAIGATHLKKHLDPAIRYYEIKYACIHGGRKFKSESTGARSSS